jgi:hypothetical protein
MAAESSSGLGPEELEARMLESRSTYKLDLG